MPFSIRRKYFETAPFSMQAYDFKNKPSSRIIPIHRAADDNAVGPAELPVQKYIIGAGGNDALQVHQVKPRSTAENVRQGYAVGLEGVVGLERPLAQLVEGGVRLPGKKRLGVVCRGLPGLAALQKILRRLLDAPALLLC